MKLKFLFVFVLLNSSLLFGQNSMNAFYIGHSLSDQIPDMVKSLAKDHPDVEFNWAYQSIPGAPLRWQWDRKAANDYEGNPPYYYAFYDQQGGLPNGEFNILVLTEAVPRYGSFIKETYQYADSFFVFANAFNPAIKVYLYEDWHCIQSGTPTGCDYDIDSNPWRERIDDDLPMWESVVDSLNARYSPAKPVCLIPAAQGLAQVYDSIYAGVMPGLSSINDIFSDDIHLNDIGKYFVACVHFSTLFETSPIGLTHQLQVWWGGDFEAPTPALALKFQQIAWEVSNTYPRSCLNATTSIDDKQSDQMIRLENYPNPYHSSTTIRWQSPISAHTKLDVLDVLGRKVRTLVNEFKEQGDYTMHFDSHGLTPGTYIYQLKAGNYLATKKMMIIK
jgi:hypothetical protein